MRAGAFTIPESHAPLVDDRPIAKLIVDVGDPLSYLTSELLAIDTEVAAQLNDETVNYIANSLLNDITSPHTNHHGGRRLKSFFHPQFHSQVEGIIDNVKDIIQSDLSKAERHMEQEIGQSIYPCNDMASIGFRQNNLAVLRYRVGKDPFEPTVDDPYAGMDPFERQLNEEADDLAEDAIVHIE